MSSLRVLVDNVPYDSLYGVFDHEEELDVRLVRVQEAEECEVTRNVHQPRGLGDDPLVWVGQGHLVLHISCMRVTRAIMINCYNVILNSFSVNPLPGVVLVLLEILSFTGTGLSPHLNSVGRSGDLRVDPQLLYDGPRPALLDPNNEDVREPPGQAQAGDQGAGQCLPVIQSLNATETSVWQHPEH